MTAGMAHEVADSGITVNCVAPGISAFEAAAGQLDSADDLVAGLAVKRFGTSRDQYEAMVYLCSDAGAYVTGHTLRVDGGGAVR
jgi:3-oxoacyl-[acyl-carrier protein] reductase